MNLLKKDFKSIVYGMRKLVRVYVLVLVICQAHFIILSDFPTLTVFFQVIAFDMGVIDTLDNFLPSIFWLLLQLLPVFSILYASYNYFIDSSSYDILRSGSRLKYFLSKFIVGFILLALFNLALYLLIKINIFLGGNIKDQYNDVFDRIIFSYLISQFILYMIGFLLSLKFSYKLGISSVLVQLILSMTTNFKWIIGQQSLAFKTDVLGGNISFRDNLIIWITYILVLFIISYIYFRNYDFLGGTNDWT